MTALAVAGCAREAQPPERLAPPKLPDGPIVLRVAYVDNPRFGTLEHGEVAYVLQVARDATLAHFGREVRFEPLQTAGIERFFEGLSADARGRAKSEIYPYADAEGDLEQLRERFVADLKRDPDDLSAMIDYASPYLLEPVRSRTYESFADALIATQLARLRRLAAERAPDGRPFLDGSAYSEFSTWDMLHYVEARYEVIVTNQLIASMEYYANQVHSAIRGGISNGITTPNLSSRLQATAIVSVQPMLGAGPTLHDLRGGAEYARRDALRYAGLLLAHEIGHLLFHLGHPYGRSACIMSPPPLLHFREWADGLAPAQCPIEARGPMSPGYAKLYKPHPL